MNSNISVEAAFSPPPVPGRLVSELVSLAAVLTHQYPHLLLPEELGEQRRDRQAHLWDKCPGSAAGRLKPWRDECQPVSPGEAAAQRRRGGAVQTEDRRRRTGEQRSGRSSTSVPRPGQRGIIDVTALKKLYPNTKNNATFKSYWKDGKFKHDVVCSHKHSDTSRCASYQSCTLFMVKFRYILSS